MKLSGTIQNVTQTTLGSQLAADVHIGDSTVTVVDGSDFNEDDGTGTGGGTLSIGGSQIDYTTIDQSTNVVTLATTLAVNASEGDRVDIVDPSTGAAALDIAAFIALPGGNGNDDFVQASVAHALALTLEQGIRDPGMGEAATIEEIHPGDGEWIVTDVRGKKATVGSSHGGQNVVTGDSEATATVSISQTLTGSGTSVGGNYGVSVGDESNSTGSENTALGHQSQANGTEDTAVGKGAVAGTGTESGATSVGARASVTANGGTAVGFESGVDADNATAIGAGATCSTPNGVEIGASGGLVGFLGATPVARAATPVTLADVIAILQALGLCS